MLKGAQPMPADDYQSMVFEGSSGVATSGAKKRIGAAQTLSDPLYDMGTADTWGEPVRSSYMDVGEDGQSPYDLGANTSTDYTFGDNAYDLATQNGGVYETSLGTPVAQYETPVAQYQTPLSQYETPMSHYEHALGSDVYSFDAPTEDASTT